nr:oxygen-regulated protein 1-like [Misgurnus anguillicaudatus]
MSDASVPRKAAQQSQSSASGHTQMTSRQPYISEPIASKHVCFYKSGDAQFSGLPVVVNSRTFRTFEALLDSLSKRVPLPFGVRTVTTPRGHTAVRSLDQLHHGHAYICSDRRTVKPVDLERAQRKLPPWYHARPVSARRLTLRKRNPAPRGARSARRNEHDALLHTPKRLVVFRNGEPEVKHTLILQKRTTQSFDSLLQYMSEVMSFPVLRLHTPDGRRVDGLPALILCSGAVVAAGREHFKKRNYDIQKTSPPTWLPSKRVGRLHPIERKKKSSISKSRPFSPSSERYVVEQIHNSIAGSIRSNPAGSLESGQPLDSIAETDMMACLDGEGAPEDDIEKSFRVNQDGSMTVEMKVRLTIKEEETINWTTTVSRSIVTNQIKALSDFSIDLDANLPALDDPVTTDSKNDNLSWPEKNCDGRVASMEQPSSPLMQSPMKHQTQASAERFRTITDPDIQENSSYKGQLANEEKVHCNRPVPRPRGTLTTEVNNKPGSFTTSEVLQQQENNKEVCKTVLHIYENQTCQENLSENMQPGLPRPGTSPDALPHSASSDPVPLDKTSCCFSADVQPETLATSKHQSTTKQLSPTHKPDTSTNNANTASTHWFKEPVHRSTPASVLQKASVSRSTSNSKRKPVRVIVKKNYLLNTANLERKRKDSKVDILKEIRKIRADLLNQTGAMKLKEHFRAKAVRKLHEQRNKTESEPLKCSDSPKTEDPTLFLVDRNPYKALQKKNILHAPQPGTLRCQTSMHEENDCQELCKAMYLPAVHSSSSLMNEYVELWLQKSQAELNAQVEPQTTTEQQKTSCHGGLHEPKDRKIKERDERSECSVFNPEGVLRTAMPMRHSCVNDTSTKSSLNGHSPLNMTSGHELTPVPMKQSSPVNPKDEKILQTPSADKYTSSPINTSQGNSQPSQPSLETIPKNNTMVKASLFNNQPAEKTPTTKGLLDMKATLIQTSHIKKPAQEKVQINSEKANQISELKNTPSYDTENGTSLKTIKEIQTQPSSERREECYSVKMAVSPDMKPVLDQLCYILQSLREITLLRLKKSKSVPDISLCLASTFGSSSRILLAFLSIMTLKDGLQRLNVRCQAESDSSCSEAMLMLRSLKEIVRIDDPDQMNQQLTDLHASASIHLLQRWKSFQELCNTAKSHTIGLDRRSSSEEEDQAIQVLMGDLGVPERVREELAAICNQLLAENIEKVNGSPSEMEENIVGETTAGLSDFVLEDYVNQYVTSVIDKAVNARLQESDTSQIFMVESPSTPDKETTLTERHEKENFILGSDICEDMSSIESSFGMGMHEELDLKRTEDRERLEDERENQTKEDKIRVERQRGIVEQTGRLEDINFAVENYKSLEVMRQVPTKDLQLSESLVSCEITPVSPDERSFGKADHLVLKHPMSYDNAENSGSQSKSQTLQTQVQINNPTRTDIVLPEQPGISHDIQPNVDEYEIKPSNTHQDFGTGNMIDSEEDDVIIETPQCYTIYQENFPDKVSEYEEKNVGFMEEKTNSVTKLISSLNYQERLVDKIIYNTDQMSEERFFNHINVENLRPKTTTDTSMDPLSSSLAFSYDTKTSTLAKDPEANIQIDRVKSIREMFLAKSNTDTRHRQTHLTTSSSDPSEFLDSIEHQLSKDDKDACRLAIAKGYVKQTIERLYGKGCKGSAPDDNRPPSAHKAKKREGHKGANVTSLASIHEARTNATSELSYFNATDCVTLKARTGPKEAVLIDKGRWLLRQNQTSPESSPQHEDTSKNEQEKVIESDLDLGKEDAPYSLFGSMTPDRVPPFAEREEHEGSTGTPFTYFHLPNAGDPEMETENAKRETDNTVTPLIKSSKGCAEKHGILTIFSLPDIKKANKVQPMTEATPPVVSQPTKGPSVQTELSKRSTEPDALEILYVFCGQHCPLL